MNINKRKRYLKIFNNLDEYNAQKETTLETYHVVSINNEKKTRVQFPYALINNEILKFFKNVNFQKEELVISNDDSISGEILTLNDN